MYHCRRSHLTRCLHVITQTNTKSLRWEYFLLHVIGIHARGWGFQYQSNGKCANLQKYTKMMLLYRRSMLMRFSRSSRVYYFICCLLQVIANNVLDNLKKGLWLVGICIWQKLHIKTVNDTSMVVSAIAGVSSPVFNTFLIKSFSPRRCLCLAPRTIPIVIFTWPLIAETPICIARDSCYMENLLCNSHDGMQISITYFTVANFNVKI